MSHRDRCSVAKLSTRAHQMRVPYKNSIAHSQGYSMLLPSRTERRDQRAPQRAILQAVSYCCFIQRPAPPGPACAAPAPLGPGSAPAAPAPHSPLGRLHGARGKKAWREIRAMPCRHASGPPARPAAGSDKGEKHIGLLLRQGRVFSRKLSLLCRSSVVCCRARLRRR